MAAPNTDILALTRKLPIPVPWDRNAFIENLGQMRGRAIRLVPTDTAALAESPCGLWLACDDEDLILHEIGTTDYHIDQIVGHEIGQRTLRRDRLWRESAGMAPGRTRLHGQDVDPCVACLPRLVDARHRLHEQAAGASQRAQHASIGDAEGERHDRSRLLHEQRDLVGPRVVVLDGLGRKLHGVALGHGPDHVAVRRVGRPVDRHGVGCEQVDGVQIGRGAHPRKLLGERIGGEVSSGQEAE